MYKYLFLNDFIDTNFNLPQAKTSGGRDFRTERENKSPLFYLRDEDLCTMNGAGKD